MKAGKVINLLQISRSTLKRYREKGILKARRLPSGQYTFDDDSVFLLKNGRSPRLTLLYGRVSTYKQKHDLANQMQELQDFAEKKGYQVCEDIINVSKTRRKRVQAKEFVFLSRLNALQEIKAYLANTYDLSDTLIISNADGSAGYAKKDFDEIVGRCKQHEHFLDVFHLNKKIKDCLGFMPAMQSKLISAVEFKYDRHLTDVILDTIESNLVDELNTPENHENLKRLRSYLHRRWVDIKPFKMRHLSVKIRVKS